jgi:iron-sulfur cluster assembly protein iscA
LLITNPKKENNMKSAVGFDRTFSGFGGYMSITLTEKAAQRVKAFLDNRGKGIGLRLGVKTSGCSGLAYVLEFVDVLNEEDQVFEQHGVNIIVDPKSLVYLNGIELDYVKEGLNEGFKYNNPNVKESCGCGESFHV